MTLDRDQLFQFFRPVVSFWRGLILRRLGFGLYKKGSVSIHSKSRYGSKPFFSLFPYLRGGTQEGCQALYFSILFFDEFDADIDILL